METEDSYRKPESRREEWISSPVRPSGINGSIPCAACRYKVRSRAILCDYGVVVTQVLAKHLSRVRIPLVALIDTYSNLFLKMIEDPRVASSNLARRLARRQLSWQSGVLYRCVQFMALQRSGYRVGLSRRRSRVRFSSGSLYIALSSKGLGQLAHNQ